MKTILFIALIAIILTTGFATAGSVDMSIYDRNDDMQIDAEERTVLDIDIEGCRLTPAEARVIDSYTINGTIILNEEFQAAFLNPEVPIQSTVTTVTIVDTPIPAEVVDTIVETIDVPDPKPADDVSSNTMLMIIGFAVICIGTAIFCALGKNDESDK